MGSLRVLVVSSRWPAPEHPDIAPYVARQADFLERAGVVVQRVLFRGSKRPSNYLRARRDLETDLRTSGADLVHAHFGQSAIAVPRDVPLVVTFYGADIDGTSVALDRPTAEGVALQMLSRRTARRADAVILASQRLARFVPRDVRFEVIPPGVDLEVFKPMEAGPARAELGLPDRIPLVLLHHVPGAPRQHLNAATEALMQLRAKLEVDLIVLPPAPPATIAKLMNACDVTLVISERIEGVLAAKETLACGSRVVAPDLPEFRGALMGMSGCELTQTDDPRAIASSLDQALASSPPSPPPDMTRYGETAAVQRLLSAYRGVLDRQPTMRR